MKFAEIPQRLNPLLHPPDPIVINHLITVEGQAPEQKKTACYDIDVEVDDTLKVQMNSFLLSTNSQMEIQTLDNKIHETVETINTMKTQREFYLSFSKDPQLFINKWLISQSRGKKKVFPFSKVHTAKGLDSVYRPQNDDGCCWQSRRGAPHGLLLPALGSGSGLPLFLSKDSGEESRTRLSIRTEELQLKWQNGLYILIVLHGLMVFFNVKYTIDQEFRPSSLCLKRLRPFLTLSSTISFSFL